MQSQEAVEQGSRAAAARRARAATCASSSPTARSSSPSPSPASRRSTMPHLEVGDYLEIEHITATASEGAQGQAATAGRTGSSARPTRATGAASSSCSRRRTATSTSRSSATSRRRRPRRRARSSSVAGASTSRRPPPRSPTARTRASSCRACASVGASTSTTRSCATSTPRAKRRRSIRASRKVARDIVGKIPPQKRDERARALYRWVGEALQEANETDGRRAITGRAGSRQAAFMYLVRLLGIQTELALVKSRIAMPPVGKMSEVETYDNVVARLDTDVGPRWMVVRDKFAPFGYVPAELRGQPAIRLDSRHSARHDAHARRRRRRAPRGQGDPEGRRLGDGRHRAELRRSHGHRSARGLRSRARGEAQRVRRDAPPRARTCPALGFAI